MSQNPACAIMTANCPPENSCALTIDGCRVTMEGEQARSTYDYRCTQCGARWTVHFPQVQPTFDRDGNIIIPPQPIVEPV